MKNLLFSLYANIISNKNITGWDEMFTNEGVRERYRQVWSLSSI
jgi:hypothetical protein